MTEAELAELQEGTMVWLRAEVVGFNGESLDIKLEDGEIVPWDYRLVHVRPARGPSIQDRTRGFGVKWPEPEPWDWVEDGC